MSGLSHSIISDSNQQPSAPSIANLPMTDENLNYAQGLVAALIAQMGPAFAYWWQQQQENQVAFSNASLQAAESSGQSQKWNGYVEAGANGISVGAGACGFGSDVLLIKNTLQVNSDADTAIKGIDTQIDEIQNSRDTLAMEDADIIPDQGPSSRTSQLNSQADGRVRGQSIRTEDDDQQIETLKKRRKGIEQQREQRLQQLRSRHDKWDRIFNPNGGVGQAISRAGASAIGGSFQENQTIQGQQGGVEKNSSEYADQQLKSSVNVYEGMIKSLDGLFSVSQAIARA